MEAWTKAELQRASELPRVEKPSMAEAPGSREDLMAQIDGAMRERGTASSTSIITWRDDVDESAGVLASCVGSTAVVRDASFNCFPGCVSSME